jgi:hypothetical protein
MNEHICLVLNFGGGSGSRTDQSAPSTQQMGPTPVIYIVT